MASRKQPRRLWAPAPAREKPTIPDALKARLQAAADTLVADVLKARYVETPGERHWSYVTDVYTRWFRSYFYFCATYTEPDPRARTSERRFARLEYAGGEAFHMAYLRHTGAWLEVYRDVPLDRALDTVRDDSYFRI
jgi:hypothetical protein